MSITEVCRSSQLGKQSTVDVEVKLEKCNAKHMKCTDNFGLFLNVVDYDATNTNERVYVNYIQLLLYLQ